MRKKAMKVMVMDSWQEYERKLEAARKKADDIHMTVNGNPLRETPPDTHECLIHKNMERLREDAHKWGSQRSGEAYRAIRSMVYTKENQ